MAVARPLEGRSEWARQLLMRELGRIMIRWGGGVGGKGGGGERRGGGWGEEGRDEEGPREEGRADKGDGEMDRRVGKEMGT